jgi:RNA polymerase sigma factor (sigma-70 family)
MTTKRLGTLVRHIHKLAGPQVPAEQSDGDLLRRFTAYREEAAFSALVERHGPLVLAVCRRVLRHEQDAEDAFQATFLVLARRAASIRRQQSVASWLYGVAHRTALRARRAAAKRPAVTAGRNPGGQADPPSEASLRELQRLLDEEVSRLPEKYRAPFVLCCLEGLSRAEAAQRLGWNEGTLSGRLALARSQLRRRLTCRGVSLTAALCALALCPAAKAAVPAALAAAAVRGVLPGAAEAVSQRAAALAEGTLRALALTRIKLMAVLLLVLGAAVVGAGLHTLGAPTGSPAEENRPAAASPAVPTGEKARADRYGDPLPAGALARMGTVRFRSEGGANWIAFLPGDKTLMTLGERVLSFWDVATGKERRSPADLGWGSAYALSSDGRVLAVATGPDYAIYLWEVAGGKDLRQLRGHQDQIRAVAFTADGRTLVSGGHDKTVRVWDTATGKEVRRIQEGSMVLAVAVSPDGKTLAAASGETSSTVRLRETATGKELRSFQGQMPIFQVLFAPDGKTLAALEPPNGGSPQTKIHLCDVDTGKVRQLPPQNDYVWSAAFAPDSKTLATAQQETFRLWDAATGKPLDRFEGKSCYTTALAFSGDGKTLATWGDNTIRLWDVATGKEVPSPGDGHQGAVEALAFVADARTLVTVGQDHSLRHWETATGKEVRRFQGIVGAIGGHSFAAEGKVLAFRVDKEVRLCEPATGKELRRFHHPAIVSHVALTSDGRTLAVCGEDRTLRLLDAATGKERLVQPPYPELVAAIAFSPAGDDLAVVVEDNTVRLVDTAIGSEIHQLRLSHMVSTLAFSPDGKTLATIDGDSVRLWEKATGQQRVRLLHPELPAVLAFSPDGTTLALGDEDGLLRLCLAGTGKELRRLRGHRSQITCLAFSADGRTLASGSWDTSAVVWDVSSLRERRGGGSGTVSAKQLEALWTDLAGDDAAKAYRAVQELAAAPEQSVPFLKGRLHPVTALDPQQIAPLLSDLDSDEFTVREKATAELEKLGESAEPGLRKALDGKPSLEMRRRLEALLQKLQKSSLGPELLRELRALEVLEQVGGEEVQRVLAALARGVPEAQLTREARSSLDRLKRRSQ